MAPEPKQPKYEGPPPLAPVNRKSLKSGLICESAVSENERPETSVMAVENFHFDAIGAATLRKGTLNFGNAGFSGSAILGMHQYIDVPGNHAADMTFAAENGNIQGYNGSWNILVSGLTPGGPQGKTRFTTFLNEVFVVNGNAAMMLWQPGGGFTSGGDVTAAPVGTQVIEVFQSRIWTMGDPNYPSRLYYSSAPTAVATPVITWNTDPTTGTWIDISPQDGDFPTALQRFRNALLVFKTNRIYRVYGIGQVDADPWYGVGTSSQESVIETKAGVFFHHASGIYQYNVYGVVQEVSRPVIDFIRAIPPANYPFITAYMELDTDHIVWAIGDVYVTSPWQAGTGNQGIVPDNIFGGSKPIFYHNCELRYTISSQVWTVYTRKYAASASLRRQPFFTDNTASIELEMVGTLGGSIIIPDFGNRDEGDTGGDNLPIPYSLTHGWDTLDGLNSTRITAQTITFAHTGGAGTKIAYQTDDDDPDNLHDWSKRIGGGTLADKYTVVTSANIKGRKMRIRLSGVSQGPPFIYNGYEVIDAQAEFYNFKSS